MIILSTKLLKLKLKIEACPVNAGLHRHIFHLLQIWLWTLVAVTAVNLETPCVCAYLSNQPWFSLNCTGALHQELSHWFCSPSLWLSSGIAFRSDCQVTGRGQNLDSNLNSAAWPMKQAVKVLPALDPWINCVEFEFFLGPLKMQKSRQAN